MRRLRKEKRRLTRKMRAQRGGAEIHSIDDWLSAVKITRIFKKKDDDVKPNDNRDDEMMRLGIYRMSDLSDSSLKLPEMQPGPNIEPNFDINRSGVGQHMDIRVEGAGLVEKWKPVIFAEPSPTPAEFKSYIEKYMGADTDTLDPDFRDAVNYLIVVENKLRRDDNPITYLTEDDKYPLFVWALMMNLPTGTEAVPALIPPRETVPAAPK